MNQGKINNLFTEISDYCSSIYRKHNISNLSTVFILTFTPEDLTKPNLFDCMIAVGKLFRTKLQRNVKTQKKKQRHKHCLQPTENG